MPIIEALAHYLRGFSTFFFFYWTYYFFPLRRRGRLLRLVFIFSLCQSLGYLKDAVFLFPQLSHSSTVDDIVSLTDLCLVPLACSLFYEVTQPGRLSRKRIAGLCGVQATFLMAYLCVPQRSVLFLACLFAAAISLVTIVLVAIYAWQHSKYLKANYSYTEDIDVQWVVLCASGYFVLCLSYFVAFSEPSWAGECLFCLINMAIWGAVNLYARRHRVLIAHPGGGDTLLPSGLEVSVGMDAAAMEPFPVAVPAKNAGPAEFVPESQPTEAPAAHDTPLSQDLLRLMEERKPYLNPKLTLADLAQEMHINRTYLTTVLNRDIGKSFYDFVNEFRITEACSIIDALPPSERPKLSDVASRSGFNSLSTFKRSFLKVKGMLPSQYGGGETTNTTTT